VALATVFDHLASGATSLERATFVLFSEETLAAFERALLGLPPGG
jgi:hypothetical protein